MARPKSCWKPTTWAAFKAAFLEAFQTLDAERIARDNMENFSKCNGSFWQVWWVLVGSCVLHPSSCRKFESGWLANVLQR